MLGESLVLYTVIHKAVLRLAEPYRKECVTTENTEWGVFKCKESTKTASPLNLGGDLQDCIKLEFNTEEDPVGIITGLSEVYISSREVNYLATIVDNWDTEQTARVLAHIIAQQLPRKIVAQACT